MDTDSPVGYGRRKREASEGGSSQERAGGVLADAAGQSVSDEVEMKCTKSPRREG